MPATARSKLDAVHANLTRTLGRPPTLRELSDALKVSYEQTRRVVMLRSAELERTIPITRGIETKPRRKNLRGRRCVVGVIRAPDLGPVETLAARNMQRVYADLIAQPGAPSDAELARRAGYNDRPDKDAAAWRLYIEGARAPSIEHLGRLATSLGVHVGELLRPM